MSIASWISGEVGPGVTIPFFIRRGLGPAAAAAETPRGRRRRTKTYQTPAPWPEALEEGYEKLVEEAPAKEIKRLIGPYLLRGDYVPKAQPPPVEAVDWERLSQDVETVIELYDLYAEYVEDEHTAIWMLLLS